MSTRGALPFLRRVLLACAVAAAGAAAADTGRIQVIFADPAASYTPYQG